MSQRQIGDVIGGGVATVNRDLGVSNETEKTDHGHDDVSFETPDSDDYPEVPGQCVPNGYRGS
jgi:hypothetical protein